MSVPARAAAGLPAGARRAWANGLDAVAGVDAASLHGLLAEDEHAFAVNMLVLVHAWPTRPARPRPSLEESCGRHERLMAELAPAAEAKGAAVAWHALWRLPPSMTWSERGRDAWMRYPAVSATAAVRPLGPEGGHKVT